MVSCYFNLSLKHFFIKKLILFCLFFSLFCTSFAKYKPLNYPGKLGIEANFQVGKVLKHSSLFKPTIDGLSYVGEVNIFKQTNGNKAWQKKLHYPEIGGGLVMLFHKNQNIIGNGFAAYAYWKYALVRSKVVDFNLKMGLGIAYSTKKYDEIKNPLNNPLGSKINAYIQIRLGLDWKIAPQFKLVTAFVFSHYSDGAVKLPNLGINTPTGTIGLIYYPYKTPMQLNRDSFNKKPVLKNEIFAKATIGFSDVTKFVDEKTRLVQSTSIGYTRYINITNKMSFGTTLEFNFAEPFIYVNTLEVQNKKLKKAATNLSINVSDEILIGRFAMHFEIGAYLYHTYRQLLPINFKIGGVCYLPEMGKKKRGQTMVLGNVKTHGSTAQLVELGTGGVWKF